MLKNSALIVILLAIAVWAQIGPGPGPGGGVRLICSGTMNISGAVSLAGHSDFTASCPGLLSTDNIDLDFNSSPIAITGFVPSTNGMLGILKFPSANTINVTVYNNTAADITIGSTITLNYRVVR
jgi:hypothetical protein